MTTRSRLALIALASAVALTSVDLRPAEAAPNTLPAVQSATGDQEWSAARKRRVARRNAVPLAAFGAIVGTIGAIAAEQRRRDYYERHYYAPHYGYAPPPVVYHEAPVYHAPRHYAPQVYHAPQVHVPRHHGPNIVRGHWQPNVQVPNQIGGY
jgi:hypothetical protein